VSITTRPKLLPNGLERGFRQKKNGNGLHGAPMEDNILGEMSLIRKNATPENRELEKHHRSPDILMA
jgi:hypothetical protein